MESHQKADRQTKRVVFGASVIGPLHVQMGLPCQDACAFRLWDDGTGVVAVADGLGSAARSDLGAGLAVEAAVEAVEQLRNNQNGFVTPLELVVKSAVDAARSMLERKAVEENCGLRDLACTIIAAVISRDQLSVAHVGDGAVVARTAEGLRLVSAPGVSEYTNETVPLTSSDWQASLHVVPCVESVEFLAVFTDGCQRAALRKSSEGIEPFCRFFDPIFAYAGELQDLGEGEEEIRALLSSKKVCANSEDDKTLVIVVLGRG